MDRNTINNLKQHVLPCIAGLAIFLTHTVVMADSSREGRLFVGGDLGLAHVEKTREGTDSSDTWLYGALRAEYALRHHLLIGIEGAGWTDQGHPDTEISEDVLSLMLTAKIYPWYDSTAFVKAGYGYAKHRYWESSSSDSSGAAYLLCLGYDVELFTLSLSFSSNNMDEETYRALTLSIGFTF